MTLLTKSQYDSFLTTHVCKVVFEKKDRTVRTMMCTLMPSLLEEHSDRKGYSAGYSISTPNHQVRCLDVEKDEWRSFTLDSVISFEVVQ